jgi:hypothetical protein
MRKSHLLSCFLRTAVSVTSDGDIGMTYVAVALALLGFVVGVAFRLRALLWLLALLLLASVVFFFTYGFGFLNAALAVMAVQAIVQGSYFVGLLVRAALTAALRERGVLRFWGSL